MLVILLFYTSIQPVYKSRLVRIIESTSLLNLIVLVGCTLYKRSEQTLFLEISIAFSFIQFTVIIVTSLIKVFYKMSHKCVRRNGYLLVRQDIDSSDAEMFHERVEDPEIREQSVHNLRNTVAVDTY